MIPDFVYICSPYKSNYMLSEEQNIKNARRYCKEQALKGYIPIAPHIYFTQFLDDEVSRERELGMHYGKLLIEMCNKVIVYGDHLSEGMEEEINHAVSLGIEIEVYGTDEFQRMVYAIATVSLKTEIVEQNDCFCRIIPKLKARK